MVLLRRGALAALLLALASLYLWLNGYEELGSGHGDGLIYLVTARHYAPYWPADALAETWAAATQFPPLYSALLAATGGTFDFRLAHGATTLCLIGAFAAFYAWLVRLGIARARAGAMTVVFGLAPGTFLQSFYLHPEGLYVALTFTALALLALGEERPRASLYWAASAAVAATILTRTVGVALLPALAIALIRGRPRAWPAMLAAAIAPAALWNFLHDPPWSYADTLRAYYLEAPPEAILATLTSSIGSDATGLADNLVGSTRLRWVVVLLGAIAAGVALLRFFRARPDAWYVFAYVAVLVIWPFPEEARRLSWVLLPFLLGYVAWAGERLAERAPAALRRLRPGLGWAPVAVLALVVLPEFILLMARATHPLARAEPAYRHFPEWYEAPLTPAQWLTEVQRGTMAALRSYGPRIPQGECAFSTMPLIAAFHTGRDVRPPPLESTDQRTFEQETRRIGCRYFIFTMDSGRGYLQFHYPLDRVRDRIEILDERRIEQGGEGERLVAALGRFRPGAE